MLFGYAALAANALLWFIGVYKINLPPSVWIGTWALALAVPAVAAWRSSKWWLALSLSPIAFVCFVLQGLHPC